MLFGAGMALELIVHTLSKHPKTRRGVAALALAFNMVTTGILLAYSFSIFTIFITALSLYRGFNMMRVIQGRMHARYLRNATRTTSFSLLGMHLPLFLAWAAWQHWAVGSQAVWAVVGILQLTAAVLLLLSTWRSLQKTTWPGDDSAGYALSDLPTLTVAIPARNETDDLQECLHSLIASDYPKLEIIVLDDCSQLRRTPEIIREFAQEGVRFIPGDLPLDTWLPKNQAYDRLAKAASGQYILFCGVDMRFEPHSLRQMLTTMLRRNKQMLCVLPQRHAGASGHFSLFQAMRYWWELALPRRLFNRPPVISSCWVITSRALKEAGGFAAVSRSIMPEAHFAKQLLRTDSYSFLRSNPQSGVVSVKHISDQQSTALRMRYPQLHKRPEQVAMVSGLECGFLLLPFGMAIVGFWLPIGRTAHVAALAASVLLVLIYGLVVTKTRVTNWWFGVLGQPLAALADIILLQYSMAKYEFSTVEWRGRNVCIPVMHVVPYLPVQPAGQTNAASSPGVRPPSQTHLQVAFQRQFEAEHELVEEHRYNGHRHRHHRYRRRRHHRHH